MSRERSEVVIKEKVTQTGDPSIFGYETAKTHYVDGVDSILVSREMVRVSFFESIPTKSTQKLARISHYMVMDRATLQRFAGVLEDFLSVSADDAGNQSVSDQASS